jgi:lipoprotein-releasing system permease protein
MWRFFLALRYLVSRRVNLVAMLGTTLGVAALILIVSIFSGYIREIRAHVRAATSDLSIQLSQPTPLARFRSALESDPNVLTFAPRLTWYALIDPPEGKPRHYSAPSPHGLPVDYVMLVGIDPALEARTTGFGTWLAEVGRPELRVADRAHPLGTETGGVLLNEQRMVRLGLAPGSKLRLTTAKNAGEEGFGPLALELQVTGAFSTPHAGFDEGNAFVGIDELRKLLYPGQDDVVTEVLVKVKDDRSLAETKARLLDSIEERSNVTRTMIHAWDERNRLFLSAVDHQRGIMKLVALVIIVVAIFLVFATLSMMVTEKTRDIGTLEALGATPGGVLGVFVTCGLGLTAAGAALGVVAGCLGSIWLDDLNRWLRRAFDIDLFPTTIYNLKRVPYELDPVWIATVVAVTLGLGLLASAVPAFRAARQDPLTSLRYE